MCFLKSEDLVGQTAFFICVLFSYLTGVCLCLASDAKNLFKVESNVLFWAFAPHILTALLMIVALLPYHLVLFGVHTLTKVQTELHKLKTMSNNQYEV